MEKIFSVLAGLYSTRKPHKKIMGAISVFINFILYPVKQGFSQLSLLVIYFLETFYDENQNVTLGDSANKINAKVGLVNHFKGKLKIVTREQEQFYCHVLSILKHFI